MCLLLFNQSNECDMKNAWILNLQIVLGTLMWYKLDDSCAHRDVFDLGLKAVVQIWIWSQTFEDTSYGFFDKEFNFQYNRHLANIEHLFTSPKLGVPTPLEYSFNILKVLKVGWNSLPKHKLWRDFADNSNIRALTWKSFLLWFLATGRGDAGAESQRSIHSAKGDTIWGTRSWNEQAKSTSERGINSGTR